MKLAKRLLIFIFLPITALIGIIVGVANYSIRDEKPGNSEFYETVIGIKLRPLRTVVSCDTAPWYGALDSAEFYVMLLPDEAFKAPARGYPKRMDYQTTHELVEWHNGPQSEKDRPVLSEGLGIPIRWLEQDHPGSAKDLSLLHSIPSLLDRADVHIAYVYAYGAGYVNRLALYILDPRNRYFYLVRFGI
jgi:hypothetical protein